MYLYFGSGRDQEYHRRQLLEVIRKPGRTIQKFCSHVAVLANKAYPLSSREREENGVAAIIHGCNFESVRRAAITNSFNANTIDEVVSLIMDMENHNQVYRLDKDQPSLGSVNVSVRTIEFQKGSHVNSMMMTEICQQILGDTQIICIRNATVTSVHSLPIWFQVNTIVQDLTIVLIQALHALP